MNMNKRIPIAVAIMLSLALAGCTAAPASPTPDAEKAALEAQMQEISDQLAAMQQQLDELKGEGAGGAEAQEPAASPEAQEPQPAPENTPIPAADILTEPAEGAAKSVADYDIPALEAETAALATKAEAAQPGADRDATLAAYRAIESELEAMENKLDRVEDQAEKDYREGLLSRADYKEVDRLLEALEDELDRAEDVLEHRLGVDD